MGFEVYYHFSEKVEGSYEKGELKTFKRVVGDPLEDVPLDKLASSITAQLARRDIFISDIEIYELTKKKVSFKETKGGIVIKNKKFLFDSTEPKLICQSDGDDNDTEQVQNPQTSSCCESKQIVQKQESRPKSRRPVDRVVFSPEPHQAQEIRSKPFKLTLDKQYEVLEKRPSPNGIGELYFLIDDRNNEHWVSDLYFVPANVNLFGDKELGFSEGLDKSDDIKLSWGNATLDSSMPNIRKR